MQKGKYGDCKQVTGKGTALSFSAVKHTKDVTRWALSNITSTSHIHSILHVSYGTEIHAVNQSCYVLTDSTWHTRFSPDQVSMWQNCDIKESEHKTTNGGWCYEGTWWQQCYHKGVMRRRWHYHRNGTRKETSYSDRRFWCSYILFIITIGVILVLYIYIYIYIYI